MLDRKAFANTIKMIKVKNGIHILKC